MFRVLAIGGFIGVIGAIGVFFTFRSFDEKRLATSGPLLFLVLGFVVACCLVLLRMSFVR